MSFPHFLVIPFPIAGHVNPLTQFSYVLAKHGCNVTFLDTDYIHINRAKITASSGQDNPTMGSQIKFVSLPDGLGPEDDRNDPGKVLQSIKSTMPAKLHKLIEEINDSSDGENNKITCIIVSFNMGWALEVGHKLGIKGAQLYPGSATTMASFECIQKLIDDGIISSETGLPIKKQEFQLCPNMPLMDPTYLPWCSLGKIFFNHFRQEMHFLNLAEWCLCNTTYELEPEAFPISPKLLPIGPLMATHDNINAISFWQEDKTCLDWLDQQPLQSVIFVSFGSLATMDPEQFRELALGLDLMQKPFLWVVRPSNNDHNKQNDAYPEEFNGVKGKIVGWAPQRKVLNHPAIACFISHCGWNSTIEGVYSGVPFLCWPFGSDQFLDKLYICDVWKVGLGFEKDENGVITRGEIKKKVEQLVGDEEIKARSLKLKEMALNNIAEGGRSSKNLNKFINWAKE